MSIRTDVIRRDLGRWLDRYSPPQAMKDNARAIQDEAEALLRVLLKFAPREGYDTWVSDALDRCAFTMKTRAWPTVGELGAACSNLRKEGSHGHSGPAVAWVADPVEINAKRINAGEAVGDEWLYGRRCVEILRSGRVTTDQIRRYRSAFFFAMKEVYGEAEALRREAEYKAKHAAAVEIDGAPVEPRDVSVAPKRMHHIESWEAAE